MITKKDNPTNNRDFEGYIPDVLDKLANQPDCNCTFELQLVADGKYGQERLDRSWSGMIGELMRGVR